MVVGVDGRSLRASANPRGIARYVETVLVHLSASHPEDTYRILVPGRAGAAAKRLAAAPNACLRVPRVDSRVLFACAALTGRPRVDRMLGRCDVVWIPAIAPVSVSTGTPLVLTVHDLSFEHRPRDYTAYERAWHSIARPRRLARRARRLIAVSATVRREVVEEWGVEPDKVVAIPPGPGRQPDSPATPAPNGPGREEIDSGLPAPGYVLAVGALEPRKCPDVLLEAHRRARAGGLHAELVFAGDGPLREQLAQAAAADPAVTVLGHVPDHQLDVLYRGAMTLVCASREEGFGLTPFEALARGVPAIVSDLPVFGETLGEGALRVPPGDAGALAGALMRIESDRELRAGLMSAGRSALAELSWERTSTRIHRVLAEAAGGES